MYLLFVTFRIISIFTYKIYLIMKKKEEVRKKRLIKKALLNIKKGNYNF